MAASPVPPSGGHLLESSFGSIAATSSPASARQPRRRRTGLVLSILGVIVVCVACVGVQWGANVGYDDALASFDDTVDQTTSSRAQLDEKLTTLISTTDAASGIAGADAGDLMDATAKEALVTALDEAMEAEAVAAALVAEDLPDVGDKPTWAWELFGETAQLEQKRSTVASMQEDLSTAGVAITEASDSVNEAGAAAVVSAAVAADAFEDAHISARNPDILALRYAADSLDEVALVDSSTAAAYADLESAAQAMLTSEQSELAEKQGPLSDSRMQAEAFARSLAPEVLLDFDWSPYVNGFGGGDSMAGVATWWYGDPGYATIELSNSVAAHWPSARSQALVAHEVGHAISVKCADAYDDSNQDNIEAWATAWAISMGYTDPANGTSAYGAPPQSLIDAAAGCR